MPLEDRSIIIVKFICAVLFHFKFESEIKNGLSMMKYAAMHLDKFENPLRAFLMGLTNAAIIMLVEIINLWNLSNITEGGTYSIMFDFIALGIIAEFDDYFIELYKNSSLEELLTAEIVFENVKMPKRTLPNTLEVKVKKMINTIKQNLKDLHYNIAKQSAAVLKNTQTDANADEDE